MNQDQLKTMESLLTQHAVAIRAMLAELPNSEAKRNFSARASESAFWFSEGIRAASETIPDKTKSGIQVVKSI